MIRVPIGRAFIRRGVRYRVVISRRPRIMHIGRYVPRLQGYEPVCFKTEPSGVIGGRGYHHATEDDARELRSCTRCAAIMGAAK